jgi:trk system potassium uptake protein
METNSKRFIIIGLGVFGYSIATELFEKGFDVLAVDKNQRIIEDIKDKVSATVSCDTTNEQAIKQLNPSEFDSAIVTIGEDFESNLLTSVILKELGVKQVISRASKPIQKQILYKAGVDLVLTPEEIVASLLSNDFANNTNIIENFIKKLSFKKEMEQKKS